MLSGVPVLGTSRGAVPEILDDGITGVIADDPAEMVAAARIADKLFDRQRIRARAVQRWSAARMADEYLEQYRRAQAEPIVAATDAAAAEG